MLNNQTCIGLPIVKLQWCLSNDMSWVSWEQAITSVRLLFESLLAGFAGDAGANLKRTLQKYYGFLPDFKFKQCLIANIEQTWLQTSSWKMVRLDLWLIRVWTNLAIHHAGWNRWKAMQKATSSDPHVPKCSGQGERSPQSSVKVSCPPWGGGDLVRSCCEGPLTQEMQTRPSRHFPLRVWARGSGCWQV